MKLRARLLIVAAIAAVPAAIVLHLANERLRARDMRLQLSRVVASQMTDDTRERCDSNANWFIAGPRPDRPTPPQLAAPDADVTAPRPPVQELPFEYFAYDDGFLPLSTAGPRFPAEFRQALRAGAKTAVGVFRTNDGTGQQQAVVTGWSGSPCAVLLFRMRPVPGQRAEQGTILLALASVLFGVALAAAAPVVARVRRLAAEARRAASDEYRSIATIGGRDELSAIAFAFNEAAADIRRRATDVRDREESLRRYIASTTGQIVDPLCSLAQRLADLERLPGSDPARAEIAVAVVEAHTLAMRLQNLALAATLKMSLTTPPTEDVDLTTLVQRVIARQMPFARASAVEIGAGAVDALHTKSDPALLEQAVNNLVDNAIRHNRPGGHATVSLDRTRDGRFSLRVEDDGPGAPDDVLSRLNAIRRFRGDEGRIQQAGELGLGLALVREVCDRLGVQWAFRRSARGWFEAELTGTIK